MKRRQFLSATAGVTGAAAMAAACTPDTPSQSASGTAAPGAAAQGAAPRAAEPADNKRVVFSATSHFPAIARRGSGFVMLFEGLAAVVVPKDGLGKKRLDVLLLTGHGAHGHVPSLFVPRRALAPQSLNPALQYAVPIAVDPNHAVFSLEDVKINIAPQDRPEPVPDQSTTELLEVNNDPVDYTKCPKDDKPASFGWLLDLKKEFATSPPSIAKWRTDTHLYHAHAELRVGRVEHDQDVINANTSLGGHKWKLANGTVRYLKHVFHYGLGTAVKKYAHIQLTHRRYGKTSIVVDTGTYFVPVVAINLPPIFTDPNGMQPKVFTPQDVNAYLPLLSNVSSTLPILWEKDICTGGTTPECGCCPPAWITDSQ